MFEIYSYDNDTINDNPHFSYATINNSINGEYNNNS